MTSNVVDYILFPDNNALYSLPLLVLYFVSLILIPITLRYFTESHRYSKEIKKAFTVITVGFVFFVVADRYNKSYIEPITLLFKIDNNEVITISGVQGDYDYTRVLDLVTHSKDLASVIRSEGELCNGYYAFNNARIKMKFCFTKFKSLTIIKLKEKELNMNITWTANEMKHSPQRPKFKYLIF